MKDLTALIFIDTNIYLDFYRIRKSDVSLSYLGLIDKHKNMIITSSQVEMEFKKNRQNVILESLKQFRNPDWNQLTAPAIISESQAIKQIEKNKKEISTQQRKINEKIEKILKNPHRNDKVYITLQKLWCHKSNTNLDRNKKIRISIREQAQKRFLLGYPPRKKEDNSIGDAVNWEWVVYCAQNSTNDIIIVTRDSDYGAILKGESFLNDWLRQEFKERVSRKRNIYLTDKLAQAFKAIKLPVSKAMEDEEDRIIETQEKRITKKEFDYGTLDSDVLKNYLEFSEKYFK